MSYQQIGMDSKSLGMDILEKNSWPQGLKDQMVANWDTFPYRFMVLDDSGSMGHMDGTKMMSSGTIMKSVNCSRWNEMGVAVKVAYNPPVPFPVYVPSALASFLDHSLSP